MSIMKTHIKTICPSESLKILGDYWTLQIIQVLHPNEKRFCELERALPAINPTTLTNRLKKLEQQKIIKRKSETVDKISVSYELTDKGEDILPILKEMKIFAEKHL